MQGWFCRQVLDPLNIHSSLLACQHKFYLFRNVSFKFPFHIFSCKDAIWHSYLWPRRYYLICWIIWGVIFFSPNERGQSILKQPFPSLHFLNDDMMSEILATTWDNSVRTWGWNSVSYNGRKAQWKYKESLNPRLHV